MFTVTKKLEFINDRIDIETERIYFDFLCCCCSKSVHVVIMFALKRKNIKYYLR